MAGNIFSTLPPSINTTLTHAIYRFFVSDLPS